MILDMIGAWVLDQVSERESVKKADKPKKGIPEELLKKK